MVEDSTFQIDTTTDFTEDAHGRDPDSHSRSLRDHHLALWRKPLPDGRLLELEPVDRPPLHYLRDGTDHGDLTLSSDLILTSMRTRLTDFYAAMGSEENARFHREGQSIGGRIIFPNRRVGTAHTINQARGMHPRIRDRFDLTLECIRRHYRDEESPLASTLGRYGAFFRMFRTFDDYVSFFLLDDLVEPSGAVRFFIPFSGFDHPASPLTMDEYQLFRESQLLFVRARNVRMLQD